MTTDYREAAEVMKRNLSERGWGKGGDYGELAPEGPWCLSMALAPGCYHRILEIIRELFPGRGILAYGLVSVIPFNDHPDTTREDIDLILKHLGES